MSRAQTSHSNLKNAMQLPT